MRIHGGAKIPLLASLLIVIAACASVEEQCRNRHGADAAAYDGCVKSQYRSIQRMLEHQRQSNQSIPEVPVP